MQTTTHPHGHTTAPQDIVCHALASASDLHRLPSPRGECRRHAHHRPFCVVLGCIFGFFFSLESQWTSHGNVERVACRVVLPSQCHTVFRDLSSSSSASSWRPSVLSHQRRFWGRVRLAGRLLSGHRLNDPLTRDGTSSHSPIRPSFSLSFVVFFVCIEQEASGRAGEHPHTPWDRKEVPERHYQGQRTAGDGEAVPDRKCGRRAERRRGGVPHTSSSSSCGFHHTDRTFSTPLVCFVLSLTTAVVGRAVVGFDGGGVSGRSETCPCVWHIRTHQRRKRRRNETKRRMPPRRRGEGGVSHGPPHEREGSGSTTPFCGRGTTTRTTTTTTTFVHVFARSSFFLYFCPFRGIPTGALFSNAACLPIVCSLAALPLT